MEINVVGTEADVCVDISSRQQVGIKKYNSTVRDNNLSLKQWLQHAYEETLDKAIYLKRAIEQIDKDDKEHVNDPRYHQSGALDSQSASSAA
jgi:hypothetical protein